MGDLSKLAAEIEAKREQLKKSLNSGSDRLKQEVEDLEAKWKEFASEAQLRETGVGVEDALRQLGSELKTGFTRIKDAVTERDRQRNIESLSHQLWIERGRPEGSPEVDWAEAERRVDTSEAD